MDTIFALSSGAPPAGIAVIRVSGSGAGQALEKLVGRTPEARRATAVTLRSAEGFELDRALALWLPGPGTATGEDIAELHLHGGRAVVAAVEGELAQNPGVRRAEPGEFTRRAFANGRIDLAEAEGLADLLAAETEQQRRSALATAGGALSRQVESWLDEVLALSAAVEAVLDFGDEDDVDSLPPDFDERVMALTASMDDWLARPPAERLRDGVRVVLAGPPNAGKSSLFNALLGVDAAIVTAEPGTTRDVIERPISVSGVPLLLVDTAGMRSDASDAIEAIGIARAAAELERADIVLWLGPEGEGPGGAMEIAAKADMEASSKMAAIATVSSVTGDGITELLSAIVREAARLLPLPGEVALNRRQRWELLQAAEELRKGVGREPLLLAERLRVTRHHFDRITGRASTEDMLDSLFGRFCIGK
ncbi:MAG: tRNA uridine-5-carboxymethylaminomethyl(34) synthesis GTPase MnmE [Tsuneonella sp.]